ncbi:MAG TPA: hypothetical protein VF546_01440 [Pyrinomonadaceae bacterium]|jgi:hypothetical protein
MPNLNTLNTLIAVVIVLLVLSLVVQSVQQGLKKLLKIKSRQIEDSLVDLFEHVLERAPAPPAGWWQRHVVQSPILRLLTRGPHPCECDPTGQVKALYGAVTGKLEELGRTDQAGKLMLDSIAKTDLLKVLMAVTPDVLTPDFDARLKSAGEKFAALKALVEDFKPSNFAAHLSADSKAKLAKMQGTLRPLISDVGAFLEGQSNGSLLGDLKNLRELRLADVLKLIAEAQQAVEQDLALAEQQGLAPAVTALTAGANGLRLVAEGVAALQGAVERALANLAKAETWYDTVMQSFEERYTRSMKTWGLVISFVVVAALNANFFTVYRNIAASDVLRNNIIQANDAVAKRYAERAQVNDAAAANQTLQAWYKETQSQVANDAALYTGLGFTPLRLSDVRDWLGPRNGWETVKANAPVSYWLHPLSVLAGWLVMTLLLSVGAPFWQDTLESLFGIKNLLRKQSDTKNVEDKGGQPRS